MLTIKRVPTVVSNYQEEAESGQGSLGCGRNCLGNCCLPAAKLSLHLFKKEGTVPVEAETEESSEEVSEISFLHNLLLGQWDDRMNQGLFRYDVTTCDTKIIPGQHKFIAQLNEGRHLKKRPTEFRVDQVLQSFDHNKFNFTKVGQEEVLFMFEQSTDHKSHFLPNFPVQKLSVSPNVVAINVSPIEYGHVLLIPRVLDCLPQKIDHDSFLLAMHMAKEAADPFFRVGYNSLGAFATINHLHFQAYYLATSFPVEKTPTQIIAGQKGLYPRGVYVSKLLNYPVRGLVFEGGKSLRDLNDIVARALVCLQDKNMPFNVLISDSGSRIFLFPQCFAERQALGEISHDIAKAQVNPAVWEIGGHMVLKRRKDFENASEAYAWNLLAQVSLSEDKFQQVESYVVEAAGLCEAYVDKPVHTHESASPELTSKLTPDSILQQ